MVCTITEFSILDINNAAPDLSRVIEQYYDLGEITEIRPCEVGDTNRNFRILCDKDGTQTWYFAKLFNIYKTMEKLEYENELYRYFNARSKGVMDCPTPISARSGESVFKGVCAAAKVNAFFMVFNYLRGRSVDESLWRNHMIDGYLQGFSRGLASFHDYGYGFKPSFAPAEQTTMLTDMHTWECVISKLDMLKENPRTKDYYAFFQPHYERILEMLRRNRAVIERAEDQLPICITHGDCSPNNYMYTGEEILTACGACDFDWAKERPRVYDISWMMCEVLSIYDGKTGKASFELARLLEFIRNYNARIKEAKGFAPGMLKRQELAVIPEMMQLAMIQMSIQDRFGYMLENNQRVGGSEENIGVTYWGLSIIDAIEENRENIRAALFNM